MKFYEEFKDRRKDFEILAFHDAKATDFAMLDAKLAPIKEQAWGGKDLPFPILLDASGETVRRFGVSSFPTAIVIDPKGKVVKHGGTHTVRAHLMKTSKVVKAHMRKLKAARTEEKFGPVVDAIAAKGGQDASFALSTFAHESAKHAYQHKAIAPALAKLGGPWAVGYFLGDHGVRSKDKAARLAAAKVLGDIGERNLLFTLSDLFNAEKDEDVRKALSDTMQKLNAR